jgi:hypothetical protein
MPSVDVHFVRLPDAHLKQEDSKGRPAMPGTCLASLLQHLHQTPGQLHSPADSSCQFACLSVTLRSLSDQRVLWTVTQTRQMVMCAEQAVLLWCWEPDLHGHSRGGQREAATKHN